MEKRSATSCAQSVRAARNFAISSRKSLWTLKKNDSRGAIAEGSRPAAFAAARYSSPSASVKAISCTAVAPASRMW